MSRVRPEWRIPGGQARIRRPASPHVCGKGGPSVRRVVSVLVLAGACLAPGPAAAQEPPPPAPAAASPPPPLLTGNVSFGLGVTSGNSQTTNFNGGYELRYSPSPRNVVKSSGLFLYGETEGVRSNEQYGLNARDEFTPNARFFLYGEFRFLHDRFKGIDYLVSPTGGVGYKIVERRRATFFVSTGVGGAWESDYGSHFRRSGAVTADQKLTIRLIRTASVGQSFYALWNVTDVHDGLYVFRANVTAALGGRMQLKVEVADTYKTKLPATTRENNDVALIASVVYRF
jgi:putative salt-induced outer membrane protein YdiY